jgi:hypothetical protein
MKSHNRILLIFGIAILAIVVASIALVLTVGQQKPAMLPENTPQGTVQRYLVALQEQDFAVAYSYLSFTDSPDKFGPRTKDAWVQMAQMTLKNQSWKANLGKVNVNDDSATVDVIVDTFHDTGPLGNSTNSHTVSFGLKKQGASWLITSPTDVYSFNY